MPLVGSIITLINVKAHKYRVKEVFIKKKCLRSPATSGAIKLHLGVHQFFIFQMGVHRI